MYAVLMVAALAVGSEDRLHRTPDDLMVGESPFALLRVGMSEGAVTWLLEDRGATSSDWLTLPPTFERPDIYHARIYQFGPDLFRRYHMVVVEIKEARVSKFSVESSTAPAIKK